MILRLDVKVVLEQLLDSIRKLVCAQLSCLSTFLRSIVQQTVTYSGLRCSQIVLSRCDHLNEQISDNIL